MSIAACGYLPCLQWLVLRGTVHSLGHITDATFRFGGYLGDHLIHLSHPLCYEARQSQVRWQICSSSFVLRQCFSKCEPYSSSVVWELARNENYWFPSLTYWIRNSRNRALGSVFSRPPRWFIMHTQVWEPLTYMWSIWNSNVTFVLHKQNVYHILEWL